MLFSIKYSEENIFSDSQSFLYYNESILLQLNVLQNVHFHYSEVQCKIAIIKI